MFHNITKRTHTGFIHPYFLYFFAYMYLFSQIEQSDDKKIQMVWGKPKDVSLCGKVIQGRVPGPVPSGPYEPDGSHGTQPTEAPVHNSLYTYVALKNLNA